MDLQHLFGYEGKTVVISGAFSGMGLAAARLLSQLGADVYAICRRNGRHNTLDFPVKKIWIFWQRRCLIISMPCSFATALP